MSAEPAAVHPLLRPLGWGDLDRVMEIEIASYPFPWTRGIFSDCLRVGYDCWGLRAGGHLRGYSVQTDAAGESHLLNLCIDPDSRRRGWGRMLLENAIRVARARHCACMFLEVRPSNRAGIELYLGRGFHIVGRRPGYYSAARPGDASPPAGGPAREDALVMRLELAAA